jgi:uncharacterized membrane protein YccC
MIGGILGILAGVVLLQFTSIPLKHPKLQIGAFVLLMCYLLPNNLGTIAAVMAYLYWIIK